MKSENVTSLLDAFRQEARTLIYSACCSKGTVVPKTEDEGEYHKLPVNIHFTFGYIDDFGDTVTELRAYTSEGWIYIVIDGVEEPIDLENLYADDIASILSYLDTLN